MRLATLSALLSVALLLLAVAPQQADARLRRGLAWGTDNRWASKLAKGRIEWYWHWQEGPVPQMPKGVEWVPNFWGPKYWGLWNQRKEEMRKDLPSRLLAFNEPDVSGQANMDPNYAADLFVQELVPWQKKGVKVSSPQIVWNLDWMDKFLAALRKKGHDVDYMAIHWYGSHQGFDDLTAWITKVRKRYNKKIWLTEYGVTSSSNPSQDDIKNFHERATAWLEKTDYVKRAAWLGCFAINNPPDAYASNKNAMFNSDGTLRELGHLFMYSALKRSIDPTLGAAAQRNHKRIAARIRAREDGGVEEAVDIDTDAEIAAQDTVSIDCEEQCQMRTAAIQDAAEGDRLGDGESLDLRPDENDEDDD